jgi:AcrR family transcriptional regulator/ketosteroid isomerase-like protein
VKKQTVEERRAEILEVTCEVVIERGFAATRISDVAKRLGVSSSLIHYHFDSKEQLLAEAFAHYARKDLAEMLAEVEAAPTSIAQLERVIQNYVPEGSDDVEWMLWIDGWGEALRNPMMKKISQELDEQSAELLERVITDGVAEGEFVCADPRAAAMRLTALVDGLAIQFAAHDGMLDRGQLIDHVRTVAAAEVGVPVVSFDDSSRSGVPSRFVAPGAATDTALRQLIARWCDAVGRDDVDAFVATWTADATWDPGTGIPLTGRDEIGEAFGRAADGVTWRIQVPLLAVFEVDEANGVGRGRVTIEERTGRRSGGPATVLATCTDRYERSGGTWRLAERTTVLIGPS